MRPSRFADGQITEAISQVDAGTPLVAFETLEVPRLAADVPSLVASDTLAVPRLAALLASLEAALARSEPCAVGLVEFW